MPRTDSDKRKEKKVESKPKSAPAPESSAYDKVLTGLQDEMVKMRKRVTFLENEVNRIRNCRGL